MRRKIPTLDEAVDVACAAMFRAVTAQPVITVYRARLDGAVLVARLDPAGTHPPSGGRSLDVETLTADDVLAIDLRRAVGCVEFGDAGRTEHDAETWRRRAVVALTRAS